MTARARERALDVGLLFAAKGLIGAWVLARGFSHVSDDDYARTVIAELFAHAPRLDPSGTSWLPFPFWLTGAAMMAFGRSLATARGVALVSGVAVVALPYLTLRSVGVARWSAVVGVLVAMATPWSAWLGVATVPEALSAGLVAAGAFAVASAPSPWLGAALLGAALSRYEAWPACAVAASAACWSARTPENRGRAALTSLLAAAGPLAWIAWNLHAHGDAFNFFSRVARYRQTVGAQDVPFLDKLSAYPMALVRGAPEIAALAAIALFSLGDRAMRARWRGPLGVAAAIVLFLVYGDLKDGAPTHHPERALLGVWWILAAFGVDGARAAIGSVTRRRPKREAWAVALATAALVTCGARVVRAYDLYPARALDEQRDSQVARGRELRREGAPALVVTPCAYEHFALVAAYGAPERVITREPSGLRGRLGCPGIEVR